MKKYLFNCILCLSIISLLGCSDNSVVNDSYSTPVDSSNVNESVTDESKDVLKTNSGESGDVIDNREEENSYNIDCDEIEIQGRCNIEFSENKK